MADLRRVVPPGRTPDRWLPASIVLFGVLVLIAIAKPWGGPSGPPVVFPSTVPRSVQPTRPPDRERYDPGLFGQDAPDPGWQLWPAGYVVDFGLAGPVAMEAAASGAFASPTPPPTPSPAPKSPPPYGSAQPIRIGQADNLVVLGINTPSDVDVVGIRLLRYDGRRIVPVSIVLLPPPWPVGHFHVIGIGAAGSDRLGPWQPGVYRLDLVLASGVTIRSVVVEIDPPGPTPGGASPAATSSGRN